MKMNFNFLANTTLLALVMLFLCGFQTAFWYQLFDTVPAPLLWINLIVYISLYRKPYTAIFTLYLLAIIAASFSAIPLKMMFVTVLILFALLYIIKSRVFWAGSGYYNIMCVFASVTFHIIYILASSFLEKNPTSILVLDRLVQIILTPSFAFPIYWLISRIDKWTHSEVLQETGGIEL